jgi:hypothetical protein
MKYTFEKAKEKLLSVGFSVGFTPIEPKGTLRGLGIKSKNC